MDNLWQDPLEFPGNTLEEMMADRKISANILSEKTNYSVGYIIGVIQGHNLIEKDFAKQLQANGLATKEFWIRLQNLELK